MHKGAGCNCCVQSIKRGCSKLGIVNNLTNLKTFQGCMNMWKGHLIFGKITAVICALLAGPIAQPLHNHCTGVGLEQKKYCYPCFFSENMRSILLR